MKSYLFALQTALILSALAARGQGTMIYDQQSATNQSISAGFTLQAQPEGQSFTPALSSVGFIQFEFGDFSPGGGVGITVYVNLRADSITGTILDSTAPVFMPYGFSFGITNFFFATPVAVTPGTTYYFQPVLQSGDTSCGIVGGLYNYPGGTFFINGAPDPDGYVLWFREGYIVPEPPTGLLVLLGVAGICLARRAKVRGVLLVLVAAGAAGIGSASAQTTRTNWIGGYLSMGHPEWPPMPTATPGCAVFAVPGQPGWWKFDDLGYDYAAAQLAPPPPPGPGGIGGDPDGGGSGGPAPFDYGTNFWLETTGVAANYFDIIAHNVDTNEYFQLLSKTDLVAQVDWTVEQQNEQPAGTDLPLTVAENGRPAAFFRGAQSDTLVQVTWQNDAIRPTTCYSGQPGHFVIERSITAEGSYPELPVCYQISGTASNGVDYTYLASVTNIPEYAPWVSIEVDPPVSFVGSNLTVTLTLIATNGYLVDTNYASATVVIDANVFELVAINQLWWPLGLDYQPSSQSLLVSDLGLYGNTNFLRIDTDGVVWPWASFDSFSAQPVLTTVKTTTNGFSQGDLYFDSWGLPNEYPTNGSIGWLSAAGTASALDWAYLPSDGTNWSPLGGLYVDQSGEFGGDLIATAGGYYGCDNGFCIDGRVWRVTASGQVTQLAYFPGTPLNGALTLTNDVARWGPWAGKIVTGSDLLSQPYIYAISANGQVTANDLGIGPVNFSLIPANQAFYCADIIGDRVWKVPASVFANHVGDVLITGYSPPALFIVHWDSGTSSFVMEQITEPDFIGELGQGAFAPIEIPCLSQ